VLADPRLRETVADVPGDRACHCHKSHHTIYAMDHNIRNLIGINRQELAKARKVIPDFHPMVTGGMADMGVMEMPMPDSALPMMTGVGQCGPLEVGSMFTVMKVRQGLGASDYRDPCPYRNPDDTIVHEAEVAAEQLTHRAEGRAASPIPNATNEGQQRGLPICSTERRGT
jgi:manganese oxidase